MHGATPLDERGIGDPVTSLRRVKAIALSLLVAFITLSAAITYLALNAPELKVHSAYKAHEPISIDGDDDLADLEDLVNGSGTEEDPYIIEWIGISTASVPALQINNTDSHIIIRHSSFWSSYADDYGIRVAEDSPTGIELYNASNVRIEYSTFRHLAAGVSVNGLSNGTFADILVSHCFFPWCWIGINASHMGGLDVESCSFEYTMSSPISLAHCSDCEVSLNRIEVAGSAAVSNCSRIQIHHNSLHGGTLQVVDSVDAAVSNNSIRYVDWPALKVARSSVVLVADNLLTQGTIYLNRSDRCDVMRNTITGSHSGLAGSFLSNSTVSGNTLTLTEGLSLRHADNCSVSGNMISGWREPFDNWHSDGLGVSPGRNTVVSNNIVERAESGISVSGGNLTVTGNTVRDIRVQHWRAAGIEAYLCSGLTVADNAISNISAYHDDGLRGLHLGHSSHVTLVRNNITNGAYLEWMANSSVHDNLFVGPARFYLVDPYYEYINLTFFRNSFMDIDVDGPGGPGISWNEDYPIGGNHWSDYVGLDEYSGPGQDVADPDGDGIGDEPYTIDPYNVDNYPLMGPVEIDDLAPPVTCPSVSGLTGDAGWHRSDLEITLTSMDGCSGVDTTHFRLDGGSWQTYTDVVNVVGDGHHVLEFYSVDRAGNPEDVAWREYNIDSQPPVPAAGIETEYRFKDATQGIVVVEFTDDLSGVSEVWRNIYDGTFISQRLAIALDDSDFHFDVWTRDKAGNTASLTIYVESSVNYDREPFSPTGPYGPLLIIALVFDIVLLIALFIYYEKWRGFGIVRPRRRPDKESWERDKVHDVEDGYTKYIKKQ